MENVEALLRLFKNLEVALWVVGGLLGVIVLLVGVIYKGTMLRIKEIKTSNDTQLEQMLFLHKEYIQEISEVKENTVKALGWLKSHEQRLSRVEDKLDQGE